MKASTSSAPLGRDIVNDSFCPDSLFDQIEKSCGLSLFPKIRQTLSANDLQALGEKLSALNAVRPKIMSRGR